MKKDTSNKLEINEFSEEAFLRLLERAESKYRERPEVVCPYFKETIHFNAKGLEHIKFKKWYKQRDRLDLYTRLRLLHLAPEIIGKSHTIQGIREIIDWERRKKNGERERALRKVFYYEFIAVIEKVRVRVIIKEVEGGVKYFWSIIPFWRMNQELKKRMLYDGDPETD